MNSTRTATLLISAVSLALLLAACGKKPGDLVVIERREPRTLIREGSAITEGEAERRKTEEQEKLRTVKEQRSLLKLQSRLAGAQSAADRAETLAKLGDLGEAAEPAREAIEGCFGDEDPDVRIAALRARIAVRMEGADGFLLRGLDDEESAVRREAVELWTERRPDDFGPLLKALHDDDPGVQYAAMTGLTKAPTLSAELLEGVAARVEDMSGSVAKAAFELLLGRREQLKDFAAVAGTLLDHRDLTVRLLVIDKCVAAGVFSKKLGQKIVQTALEDPELPVRVGAYRWLQTLAPLKPPVFDPEGDDQVRWQGRDALMDWLDKLED